VSERRFNKTFFIYDESDEMKGIYLLVFVFFFFSFKIYI